MTTYQMYLMLLGFLEGAGASEEFKDILLELYKKAIEGEALSKVIRSESKEVQHENKEMDDETIRTTNDMIESTVAQLERISKHLGSIGETEDYTDYAINVLEDFGKAYKCGLNNAWECARKISHMEQRDINKMMGGEDFGDINIIDEMTPVEAIEKVKEYEKNKEQISLDPYEAFPCKHIEKVGYEEKTETDMPTQFDSNDIKVGDEVVVADDIKGVVTDIIDLTDEIYVTTVYGWSDRFNKVFVEKTGKHYPQIEEVLEQMKRSKEND